LVCEALARHASAHLRTLAPTLLPLVLLGVQAAAAPEAAAWRAVLEESVSVGPAAAVRAHPLDVLEGLRAALQAPAWPLRQQAAQAIGAVATMLGLCACLSVGRSVCVGSQDGHGAAECSLCLCVCVCQRICMYTCE
jgi:hypothetical protein